MKHEKGVWVLHGSQEWDGKGLGRLKMVSKSVVGMVWKVQKRSMKKMLKMKHEKGVGCFSWFPRVRRGEGFGKAENET